MMRRLVSILSLLGLVILFTACARGVAIRVHRNETGKAKLSLRGHRVYALGGLRFYTNPACELLWIVDADYSGHAKTQSLVYGECPVEGKQSYPSNNAPPKALSPGEIVVVEANYYYDWFLVPTADSTRKSFRVEADGSWTALEQYESVDPLILSEGNHYYIPPDQFTQHVYRISGDHVWTELDKNEIAELKDAQQYEPHDFWTVRYKLGGGVWLEMTHLKGGSFDMGSNDPDSDEKPVHPVSVEPFSIGSYEVTNAQYRQFLSNSGYDGTSDADDDYLKHFRHDPTMPTSDTCPVVYVSWKNAKAFCEWLSRKTGRHFRLPTEAEWEYACRARIESRYSFGDSVTRLGDYAWFDHNSNNHTHPVGRKRPNAFGLFEMHGNVWEWCEDDWHDNYHGAPRNGKAWVDAPRGSSRVFRGGSWTDGAWVCRSAFRYRNIPAYTDSNVGFRVALSDREQ